MWAEFIVLLTIALAVFYKWATRNNDFFAKRGIPYYKPTFMLGSVGDMILQRKSIIDVVKDLYNKSEGKYYGMFDQRQPVYLIRDPELLKQITVKDFDHFLNHRNAFGDDDTNILSNSLFFLKDAKWKDMRSTLSPVFTGSKMRHMFELINKVAQNTAEHLKNLPEVKNGEGLELDIKDNITRFTNDVIASAAFGLEVNSLQEKNNEFYMMGKKLTTFTKLQNLKFFFVANFQAIAKIVKMSLFDEQMMAYFNNLVLGSMQYRKEHNIHRPDMITMLMEARGMIESENQKTHNREWSDQDILAQCFLFFFAGFETTSLLVCLIAHELMEHPDVQQRLYEEIQSVQSNLDGAQLTYEALNGMKYLDMIVSETLRKWPPAPVIDRVCSKDFVYEADGDRLEVKRGDVLWIPVIGFQNEPKNFPDPEKFDPERFSDENKGSIKPFTYLPFGQGPRNCIGSRLALLEVKALIYYLVSSLRIEPAALSTIPLKLSAQGFQIKPVSGFQMKIVERT